MFNCFLESSTGQEETRLWLDRILRVVVGVEIAAALCEAKALTDKLILDAWNKVYEVVRGDVPSVRYAAPALSLT